jgi:hypothetical protein
VTVNPLADGVNYVTMPFRTAIVIAQKRSGDSRGSAG